MAAGDPMTALAPLVAPAIAVIGVLGAAIGSFLNVVIYRVPQGISVVSPPSACPSCHTSIRRRDNVPVLSWLILRGRCRDCAAPISVRYPVVEALTAVLFVSVAAAFNPFVGDPSVPRLVADVIILVAYLYLMAISVALTAIDLDLHRLPNAIVLPGYAVGVVLLGVAGLLSSDLAALGRAGAGAAILFTFYFLLAFAYPGGMGFGDVKLAGVLGLFLGFLGWQHLIVGVAAAFILGGVLGLALILIGKASRKSGIPFGPWMLAGTWIGIYAGAPIFDGYLSLVGLN
jgi:leader peptidase (prepilin peptidase)/N-methyltransferase